MNRINQIKKAVFNVQNKKHVESDNKLIDSVIKSEYCTTPDSDKVKTLNFN